MKTNKRMFILLAGILIVIACISFYELKQVTSYSTKDSLSIDKCLGHTDVVTKYDDLKNCPNFDFDELDPDGVPYDEWKDSNVGYSSLSLEDCCYAYNNGIPLSPDYYTIFYGLLNHTRIMSYYYLYIVGLVVFCALYGINKIFRSKFLFYYTQREKYSKFIIKSILKCYGYVFAIVIFFAILFIFSRTMSDHLDRTFMVGASTFHEIYYDNKFFLLFYCIQTCLMCMIFINVGFSLLKYNRLIFVMIETYIVYFIVVLVMSYYSFVSINILFDGREVNIYVAVLWTLFYFLISLIPVILAYRNKEDVLMKLDRSLS